MTGITVLDFNPKIITSTNHLDPQYLNTNMKSRWYESCLLSLISLCSHDNNYSLNENDTPLLNPQVYHENSLQLRKFIKCRMI